MPRGFRVLLWRDRCTVFKTETCPWASTRWKNTFLRLPDGRTAYCCCFRGSGGSLAGVFLFYHRGVLRRFWTVCGFPEAARRARTLWRAPVNTTKHLGAVPGQFVAVFRVAVFPRPFSFCAKFKFNHHNDFRDK